MFAYAQCVYVCMYIYISVCVCVCARVRACVRTYVRACVCVCLYTIAIVRPMIKWSAVWNNICLLHKSRTVFTLVPTPAIIATIGTDASHVITCLVIQAISTLSQTFVSIGSICTFYKKTMFAKYINTCVVITSRRKVFQINTFAVNSSRRKTFQIYKTFTSVSCLEYRSCSNILNTDC